jgi:hypothetical protein
VDITAGYPTADNRLFPSVHRVPALVWLNRDLVVEWF